VSVSEPPRLPAPVPTAWYGDPASPDVLVLAHAFPLTGAMWGDVLARLPPTLRVGVPELVAGAPVGEPPSIDRLADGVLAALDAAAITRAVVAGVSMGGYVALSLARRHPHRLAGLGLIDTRPDADSAEQAANRRRIAEEVSAAGSAAPLAGTMLDTLLGATTRTRRREVVERVRSWIEAADPAGVAWCQRAMATRPDSTSTLVESGKADPASRAGVASAATPTTPASPLPALPALVLVGAEDVTSPPAVARRMAELLGATASYVEVPEAGHLSPVERPDVVAAALEDLVRRAGAVSQ